MIIKKEDFKGKCIKLERDISMEDWYKMVEKLKKLNLPIKSNLNFSEVKGDNYIYVRPMDGEWGNGISNYSCNDEGSTQQEISLEEFLKEGVKTFKNVFEALAWLSEDENNVIEYMSSDNIKNLGKMINLDFQNTIADKKRTKYGFSSYGRLERGWYSKWENIKEYRPEEKDISKEVQKAIEEVNKKFGREVCGLVQGIKIKETLC